MTTPPTLRPHPAARPHDDGFTLVEMIVSVTIMAGLLGAFVAGIFVALRTMQDSTARSAAMVVADQARRMLAADIQSAVDSPNAANPTATVKAFSTTGINAVPSGSGNIYNLACTTTTQMPTTAQVNGGTNPSAWVTFNTFAWNGTTRQMQQLATDYFLSYDGADANVILPPTANRKHTCSLWRRVRVTNGTTTTVVSQKAIARYLAPLNQPDAPTADDVIPGLQFIPGKCSNAQVNCATWTVRFGMNPSGAQSTIKFETKVSQRAVTSVGV